MMFDPSKPVQQRNGLAARVLAQDIRASDGQTIAAAVETHEGLEEVWTYQPNGRFGARHGESSLDLVNQLSKDRGAMLAVIEDAIRRSVGMDAPSARVGARMVLDRLIAQGLIPIPPASKEPV